METLFILAVAPVLICLFYVYIRDKYEKEPLRLLLTGVVFGVVITFPIIQTETIVTGFMPITGRVGEAFYVSFAVAAFVEEAFKFAVLFFLTWDDRNLNEPMDGIVYAVFISLGFAGIENVLYVFSPDLGGISTALSRAIFSVPGHALFGVTMGYFFTLGKFEPEKRVQHLMKAFFVTFLLHGLFDFILLVDMEYYMVVFLPFVAFLWINGLRKIKKHLAISPFR